MTHIFSSKSKQKGFTLIELLVVIAVIGMLASIVLVSLGPARAKARDAKRVADIRQISLAMEMCFSDSTCNGVNDSSYKILGVTTGRLTASQIIGTYMGTIPIDPGGGTATCTTAPAAGSETSGGEYCAITGATVAEYCIYARLSDGRVFTASETGAGYMPTNIIPTTVFACP